MTLYGNQGIINITQMCGIDPIDPMQVRYYRNVTQNSLQTDGCMYTH